LAIGADAAVSLAATQYATYAGPGRAGTAAAWVGSWVWFLAVLPFTLILLVFPDGRPRWVWTRAVAWAQVALTAAGALALALSAITPTEGIPGWYHNPMPTVPGAADAFQLIQDLLPVGWLIAGAALLLRWWRARDEERRQVAVFAMAGLLAVAVELVAVGVGLEPVGFLIAWPLLALTTAAVVLRWRLYGIDTLLSRTVVGATLTGLVAVAYLALVTTLGALVGRGTVTAVAATAVIAFAFHPVQRALRAAAHRLVYGARPAPQQVLSAFAQRAGAIADDEVVLADLATLVADAVGAADASVSVMVGNRLRPVPLDGRLVAVHDGGDQVGALSVRLRTGAELTPADETLLATLAGLAAPVLRALRLRAELHQSNTELAASRARLAAATTQERRRMERDLHDGAQQRLIAVKLQLGMAARATQRVAHGDTAAAAEAADAVEIALRHADQAIDDLRDLVHGIYPTALDTDGLAAALRGQARLAPLPVSVHDELAPGLRYPRDIEAAAYFCCLEAINNAAKHAAAQHIVIRLRGRRERLEFAVTDDGGGLTPGTGSGRGLLNLADRAAALGGQVTVTSHPAAGTTVSGWLPSP
jgi:signal transduction histidine kinase